MGGNRRAGWHDYTRPGFYHITLLKSAEVMAFGALAGDYRLPVDQKGSSYIAASAVGRAVKRAVREIPQIHPALGVMRYALMPDHLHLLLVVRTQLDEVLGRKIGIFKSRVNSYAGMIGVFEEGFNDHIIMDPATRNNVYSYIQSNAIRLAVRRAHPDFFMRRSGLVIDGISCQTFGNTSLLDNPYRLQVIVHRADSDADFAHHKERWMHAAANGGVLISPFISRREKEVRTEAEQLGSRLILITNRPFGEREKPAASDFALCAQGRLLIIAPQTPFDFSRAACLKMNDMAEALARPAEAGLPVRKIFLTGGRL